MAESKMAKQVEFVEGKLVPMMEVTLGRKSLHMGRFSSVISVSNIEIEVYRVMSANQRQ
jgi:hypothetical protein